MRILDKIRVVGCPGEIVLVLVIADGVFARHGHDMIWSCGPEGTHSRASLHYNWKAVDVDAPGLTKETFEPIAKEIRSRLGNNFDVINEGSHIHIELQPKEPK